MACTCLRSYRFQAHYHHTSTSTTYAATVIVRAHSRDEAIAEFKAARYELTEVPRDNKHTITPLGKQCAFTCEAVECAP